MALVQSRLRQLGENDAFRQLWFVRASLATTVQGQMPVRLPVRPSREGRTGAGRDQLLRAAEAVGQRLEALALRNGTDISWIGLALTRKDNWSLVPLGLDLYNGLPGMAFFLAYLGASLHESRYTTLAREVVATVRRHASAYPLHRFSVGAFDGLGGLVYLFTHLGTLWNDAELLDEARRLAASLGELVLYDRKFDITSGAAGCIVSLAALQSVAPCERTVAAAVVCGDHLLAHAQSLQNGRAWPAYFPAKAPLTGLAHGAGGIAWALLELFEFTGEKRFREAALDALDYEDSLFSAEKNNWPDLRELMADADGNPTFMAGWCHGAPGIFLARLRALQLLKREGARDALSRNARHAVSGLQTTLDHGFRSDHSLCHGSLGNLEPLLQASELLDGSQWTGHLQRVTAEVLQSIHENGWLCGVPLGVETPGLMTGIAGIGYGLLRLAEPARTPSNSRFWRRRFDGCPASAPMRPNWLNEEGGFLAHRSLS